MPRTSWSLMKSYSIAVAPEAVRNAFGTIAEPMHAKIRSSVGESRTLAELRDYLLPKLISGEVRVHDVRRICEVNMTISLAFLPPAWLGQRSKVGCLEHRSRTIARCAVRMEAAVREARVEPAIITVSNGVSPSKSADLSDSQATIGRPNPAAGNGIFGCRDRRAKAGLSRTETAMETEGSSKSPHSAGQLSRCTAQFDT